MSKKFTTVINKNAVKHIILHHMFSSEDTTEISLLQGTPL